MTVNILLVEDDEGDAYLLQEAMDKANFDNVLHHCKDGIEALEFLQDATKPRPHLIFLDLNMPRMDGHETLKWIKAENDFKDIPVGILTTSLAKNDVMEAYKNYASYYITKPTTFDDLQAIITAINDFWVNTVKLPGKM